MLIFWASFLVGIGITLIGIIPLYERYTTGKINFREEGPGIAIKSNHFNLLNINYGTFERERAYCLNGQYANNIFYVSGVEEVVTERPGTKEFLNLTGGCLKDTSRPILGLIHTHSPNSCRFSSQDYVTFGRLIETHKIAIFGLQCGIGKFLFIDTGNLFQSMPIYTQ